LEGVNNSFGKMSIRPSQDTGSPMLSEGVLERRRLGKSGGRVAAMQSIRHILSMTRARPIGAARDVLAGEDAVKAEARSISAVGSQTEEEFAAYVKRLRSSMLVRERMRLTSAWCSEATVSQAARGW